MTYEVKLRITMDPVVEIYTVDDEDGDPYELALYDARGDFPDCDYELIALEEVDCG